MVEFTKMQGLGNDYILIDCRESMPVNVALVARRLSDRHFGIGGDGVICICKSKEADFRMEMYNADGSEGAMCGNGIRCFGKYVYERSLTEKKHLTVETMTGNRSLDLRVEKGKVIFSTVDMGAPTIGLMSKITVDGNSYTGIEVSMGNPHFVIPVASVDEVDVQTVGRSLECSGSFPDGVNVEFVRPLCRGRVKMRVWERGSGETMACGTGACAAVAALAKLGRVEREVTVNLPGGELDLVWRERDGHLLMTGPAVEVFKGECENINELCQ